MPAATLEQFAARVARGQGGGAVLLLGTDSYLRDETRKLLIEACVPAGARDWGVLRLSLEDTSLHRVFQQAQTRPMLAPRQAVIVSGVQALEGLGEEAREAAARQIETYLKDPAPFSLLIFEAASLDARMRIFKALQSGALVVSVNMAEGADRDGRPAAVTASLPVIAKLAQELGVRLEGSAAEELAEALDGELGRIRMELEKLATYAGETKRITAEDVDALVVSDQKSSVWQLADMLAERKGGRAIELLHRLIAEGEQLPMILGGLAWMYRKLIEAQEAPRHLDGWAAAGYLKMRAETAKLALASARRIPRARLMSGLAALYEADSQLKGGAADQRAVMEFLVARLTA